LIWAKFSVDLGKTALVVIDVQKGIVAMDRKLEPYTADQVVANVSKLVRVSMKNSKQEKSPVNQKKNLESLFLYVSRRLLE